MHAERIVYVVPSYRSHNPLKLFKRDLLDGEDLGLAERRVKSAGGRKLRSTRTKANAQAAPPIADDGAA